MKKVGLTQRVELVEAYSERRDALDQQWCRLLEAQGMVPVPLCNRPVDVKAYLDALDLDAVILTGGNDLVSLGGGAPERDRFEAALIEYCRGNNLPLLGVCRGAQMINAHLGGELVSVEGHVATRHGLHWADQAPADWTRIDQVNSFHNFGIEPAGLADSLEPLAWSEDGWVEAFRHPKEEIVGMFWHPEREQPFGALLFID